MNEIETDRSALLQAAKWFLENIFKRDDIEKIAFLGSICTNKKYPKDIDILVYLKPGADIESIAALKRKFQGRIDRGTMGADIFLAENGKYIGRACCYKEPWVRAVCAQQKLCCNRDRIFLCDTSQSFALKPEIVANPPVVVYPDFSTESAIPNDLKEMIESVLRIKDDN